MKHPAVKPIKKVDSWYIRESNRILARARKLISEGVAPEKAARMAMSAEGLAGKMMPIYRAAIVETISGTVSSGVTISSKMSANWLSRSIGGQSFSARIYDTATDMQKKVTATMRAEMKTVNAWRTMAQNIQDAGVMRDNLPAYMDNLVSISRRASAGDAAAVREYAKAVSKAKRNIDALGQNDAPNQALKRVYGELLKATDKGIDKAIDKTLERAIAEKSRYNAERLVRTETARAYGDSFVESVKADPDVIGIKAVLSPRHPRPDICDDLTDKVYPIDGLPDYPFHPNCLCLLEPVYK